jgi:preprotein translocase subunit SecE
VVVATVFAFAAYFAVVDSIFSRGIGKLIKMFSQQ